MGYEEQLKQAEQSLELFRAVAADLAVEAGITEHRVDMRDIENSVLKDVYYQQLLVEVGTRFKQLSIRYEKLLNQQTRSQLHG